MLIILLFLDGAKFGHEKAVINFYLSLMTTAFPENRKALINFNLVRVLVSNSLYQNETTHILIKFENNRSKLENKIFSSKIL